MTHASLTQDLSRNASRYFECGWRMPEWVRRGVSPPRNVDRRRKRTVVRFRRRTRGPIRPLDHIPLTEILQEIVRRAADGLLELSGDRQVITRIATCFVIADPVITPEQVATCRLLVRCRPDALHESRIRRRGFAWFDLQRSFH